MAKVCLVSSPGGHLTQILSIAAELADEHEFFLCITGFPAVRNIRLDEVRRIYGMPVYWKYQDPFGIIVSVVAALFQFVRVFRKERPDFLITTGAELALPALIVNKIFFRRPSLFIESVSRIASPSRTGRYASRLADRVFVQWPELLKAYGRRAEYHGRLL